MTIAQNTDLRWQNVFFDVLEISNVREHIGGEPEVFGRELQEVVPMALAMYPWQASLAGELEPSVTSIDRTTFFSVVQTEIERQKIERQPFGVALIDLDRFMFLGDALGHDVLDKVLHIMARRIRTNVSQLDNVTWLGGDEFAVLLRDPVELKDIVAGSQRIADFIRQPLRIAGQTIRITASIGVALCESHIVHPHELLRHANTALKDVKYHGKDGLRVYDGRRDNQSTEQLAIENELYTAIDNHELFLVYQPRIRAKQDGEVSVEALLRWNHPTRGFIPPCDFIPLAEQSRLIVNIGEWVMSEVCRQLGEWQREGLTLPRIAVNVSAKQLGRHDFLERLEYWKNRYGIDSKYLEVEITETALIDYSTEMLSTIEYLRDHGMTVSIDDFGTGYASLETLKQFSTDALKIDQSFVRDLTERNQAIVVAMIQLAHSLNSKVIAEGVETKEQQNFLLSHGCDEFQGYLYSRPISAVDIAAYISNPARCAVLIEETV